MGIRYFDTDLVRYVEPVDMEVVRGERPWLASVWEPLTSKVPGPSLARPHCCYRRTVIFYLRPYVVRPWHSFWRTRDGKVRASPPPGGFERWAEIETRLSVDQGVEIDGEEFKVGCGTVHWRGRGRGWWVCHPVRRRRVEG